MHGQAADTCTGQRREIIPAWSFTTTRWPLWAAGRSSSVLREVTESRTCITSAPPLPLALFRALGHGDLVHCYISKGDMKCPGTSHQVWDQRILKAELSKPQELTGSYSQQRHSPLNPGAQERHSHTARPRALDPRAGWGAGPLLPTSCVSFSSPSGVPRAGQSCGSDKSVSTALECKPKHRSITQHGSIRSSDLSRFSSNVSHAHT